MVKTITLTGAEAKVLLDERMPHVWIENQSSGTVYASRTSGIAAKADGVLSIRTGESKLFVGLNSNELYLLGTGDVELQPTAFASANFKKSSGGGGGTGTSNYEDLTNKPSIDSKTLSGAMTYSDFANFLNTESDQTVDGIKDFVNGLLTGGIYVNGTIPVPTDKGSGVTMGYSTAAAMYRLLTWLGSAYGDLGVGAYVGGKVSTVFKADGTVKFNFNITAPNISTTKSLSILTSAWVADTTYSGYGYRATIIDVNITTTKDVDVAFDMASITVAQTANIGGATTMYDGGFYLYAKTVPTATLTGTYTVKAVV